MRDMEWRVKCPLDYSRKGLNFLCLTFWLSAALLLDFVIDLSYFKSGF